MAFFITFEGPEGGGKSTQARRLQAALTVRGYDAVGTREPGGTEIGEAIRHILLTSRHSAMLPETEALLNTAARAQHTTQVILPALRANKVVICDRFVDSTLAYQGAGRGLDVQALRDLQTLAIGGLQPDLTILLDVPYEVGQARRRASGEPLTRFDADERDFHERVRAWFLQAANDEPGRWCVVDATGPDHTVEQTVVDVVLTRLAAPARADRNNA